MKLTATQPVEGAAPGETIDVDEKRGAWLLANGYATKPGGNPTDYDGATNTSVPADQDPTLGRNQPSPPFARGGKVPGPDGNPQPILAHGGEEVLDSRGRQRASKRATAKK